jgi:hypothetical protein
MRQMHGVSQTFDSIKDFLTDGFAPAAVSGEVA